MNSVDKEPVVLIADDDPDDRMMIQEAFTERCPGCRLCFVQDGEELMAFLSDRAAHPDAGHIPDLLMLDLNMPLKDGREALVEIKANHRYRTMPAVVMTTSASEEDRQFCLENGADRYIVKPPGYTELLEVVAALKPYFTRNTDPN
jgi:CheY-like chemotaxis protein